MPRSFPVEVKVFLRIEQGAKVMCLGIGSSWMDPITSYIRDETLPVDRRHARKLMY